MTDQDHAVATRNRIGRLYGFTGTYGTGEQSETEIVEEKQTSEVQEQETDMEMEMVFNRFGKETVGGRILTALAAGPKTPAQIANVAKVKSADNILAPGGWYYLLRKFGKTSGKFRLEKDGNKLVLTVSKRYVSQV